MAFPYDLQVLVAFTTPSLSGTPSWEDVTDYVLAFTTNRGRSDELAVIQPGTCSLVLDNSDGTFEPDNELGDYYGYLRPMRRLRIVAQADSLSTPTAVWDGYVDSWTPTYPNGAAAPRLCVVEATDRFKVLSRRSYTETRIAEDAEARMTAILENGGLPNEIVPAAYRSINPDGYATRDLVTYPYEDVNALQAVQDVSLSDGGAIFMDPWGVFTFQSTRFRTDNTRATTSQGIFGNTSDAIPVESDVTPTVSDDIMANYVTVTCGDGSVEFAQDATSITEDGLLVLDIGNTLLDPADGQDRCDDVLLLRKDPRPRVPSITVDCTTSDDAMTQALEREISDRLTIKLVAAGASQGYSRDQYVEAISHDVNITGRTWQTTFTTSGALGGAVAIDPDGDPIP